MKKKLIHFLGGKTTEECASMLEQRAEASFKIGSLKTLEAIRSQMQELYGKPNEEYISELWAYINNEIERV